MTDRVQLVDARTGQHAGAAAVWRTRWRRLRRAGAGVLVGLAVLEGLAVADAVFVGRLPEVPPANALWMANRVPGVTFVGAQGQVLGHRGAQYGAWVRLNELPGYVPQAFLAIEDRRFYEHHGLDWRGVARAAVVDLKAGQPRQGGSTLTQQLARMLFLKPEQTFRRKAQELLLARRLEHELGKDDLLELYLNRIYFGDHAYGLAAASQAYFAKAPSQLTVSEAALLAGLPKAPSRLSPANDLDAAWTRGRLVLAKMVETGVLSEAQAEAAAADRPQLRAPAADSEGAMRWVFDAAQGEARVLVGDKAPDLVIKVTADPTLQEAGWRTVQAMIRGEGRARGAREGALVALDPDGGIRAMVGGVDPSSAFNRAAQAQRQPGSAFKPFVWAAALEHGVHPGDVRSDGFIRVGNWTPSNFGGGSRGMVTVAQALQQSLNTVSVRLALETGVSKVAALARRFGLQSIPEHPGPSLALGAYEVSLLQLTAGYQGLQTGGRLSRPYLISEIDDGRGQPLYQHPPSGPTPVYDQLEAAQMVRMLEGVIGWGTGRRAGFGRVAAGKTGTSQDFRDAWFVGFTPDWVAGVWVGNDDSRPMAGVTGGQLPAEIWRRFMIIAHDGLPPRDFTWAGAVLPEPSLPLARSPWRGSVVDDGAAAIDQGEDEEDIPAAGWTEARADGGQGPWREPARWSYRSDGRGAGRQAEAEGWAPARENDPRGWGPRGWRSSDGGDGWVDR